MDISKFLGGVRTLKPLNRWLCQWWLPACQNSKRSQIGDVVAYAWNVSYPILSYFCDPRLHRKSDFYTFALYDVNSWLLPWILSDSESEDFSDDVTVDSVSVTVTEWTNPGGEPDGGLSPLACPYQKTRRMSQMRGGNDRMTTLDLFTARMRGWRIRAPSGP